MTLIALPARALGGDVFDQSFIDFARQLDVRQLELLPVQYNGRVAILDTLAREQMRQMTGSEALEGLPAVAAYFEIHFNPGAYMDRPLVLVKERAFRQAIAQSLEEGDRALLLRTGRLAPRLLLDEQTRSRLLGAAHAPATAPEPEGALRSVLEHLAEQPQFRGPMESLNLRYSVLADDPLRLIPAGSGWLTVQEAQANFTRAEDRAAADLSRHAAAKLLDQFADAWRRRDALRCNRLAGDVARAQNDLAAGVGPPLPGEFSRQAERFYNRTASGTVTWALFALATVLLIFAAAGIGWARPAGLTALAVSTLALAAGFAVRWAISGRAWYLPPIMNQFEAVVGSALLAAAMALVMERFSRRNYLALAAALYATCALLAGFFLPQQMGAGIKPQAGILSSPVMAIHVALIIIGHAMVGMTFFISVAYVVVRVLGGASKGEERPDNERPEGDVPSPAKQKPANQETNRKPPTVPGSSVLEAIDRSNLIVAQLAAWMVIAGTFLGSFWADFAWGRWWGWDAKEVWAMMTALIFIAILHLRLVLPPRWRGPATAILCMVGTAVMLFNWIGVSYYLTGMHSYA